MSSVCFSFSPPFKLPPSSTSTAHCRPPCIYSQYEFTMLAFTSTAVIHKHVFVRRRRRPALQEMSGNTSSAAGLSVCVWGWAGYHVHLNKGPVFRQALRPASSIAPLCRILMLALRLLHKDELSRNTCCLQSGCSHSHTAQSNKAEQKGESCSASKLAP